MSLLLSLMSACASAGVFYLTGKKGHDSFLLEPELYEDDIKAYLQ